MSVAQAILDDWLDRQVTSRIYQSYALERHCSICHLIRPTSIPSKRHGPSSNNCSARPKLPAKKPSTKPSPNYSHTSQPKTLKPGSDFDSVYYSSMAIALGYYFQGLNCPSAPVLIIYSFLLISV